MDREQAYRMALELASTARYREAREKLAAILAEHPDDCDALVLLGKVEYHLGNLRASRGCFETALTYESGNMAAYFGLEYHRQRGRSVRALAALCAALLIIVWVNLFIFLDLKASVSAAASGVNESLAVKIEGIASVVHSGTRTWAQTNAEILAQLRDLSARLRRHERSSEIADEKWRDELAGLKSQLQALREKHEELARSVRAFIEKRNNK